MGNNGRLGERGEDAREDDGVTGLSGMDRPVLLKFSALSKIDSMSINNFEVSRRHDLREMYCIDYTIDNTL